MKISIKNGALLAILGMLLSILVSLVVPTVSSIYDYDLYLSKSFQIVYLVIQLLHTTGLLLLSISLYQAAK